jgi:hypothetical protein
MREQDCAPSHLPRFTFHLVALTDFTLAIKPSVRAFNFRYDPDTESNVSGRYKALSAQATPHVRRETTGNHLYIREKGIAGQKQAIQIIVEARTHANEMKSSETSVCGAGSSCNRPLPVNGKYDLQYSSGAKTISWNKWAERIYICTYTARRSRKFAKEILDDTQRDRQKQTDSKVINRPRFNFSK